LAGRESQVPRLCRPRSNVDLAGRLGLGVREDERSEERGTARENGQAEGDLYPAIEGLVDEGNIELG
jgi:hypothetical protein